MKVIGLNFKDANDYLHKKGYKLLTAKNGGTDVWNNRVIYGKGYKRIDVIFKIIRNQYIVTRVKKYTPKPYAKYIK